jgi:serine/threonine protein kinase
MKPKEDQHSRLELIRKVFADLLSIVDTLHNDAKLCLLSMRPDRILISKIGEEYEPYIYDFSMASDLGGEDPDTQLANAL